MTFGKCKLEKKNQIMAEVGKEGRGRELTSVGTKKLFGLTDIFSTLIEAVFTEPYVHIKSHQPELKKKLILFYANYSSIKLSLR